MNISENIHERLKEVYDEFDHYCRLNNINYSIDADYYNVQAYRTIEYKDVPNLLRHMANHVKDKWVELSYDGFPVNYDELKSNNFNVSTHNPLFKFTLKPLQEGEMNEDQIKGPTNAQGRKQAAFPSSFRKNKTRDTYEVKGKQRKRKEKSESLDRSKSFDDRLMDSINENVGISMVEPDILLTRNPAERKEGEEESIEAALQAESLALRKYLAILENSHNEARCVIVENLIERCTRQINDLNSLKS